MKNTHLTYSRRELRVVLIETASKGQRGSMASYAELVDYVLCRLDHPVQIRVRRVRLAPPLCLLAWLPDRFRTMLHHVWVTCAAIILLIGRQADLFHIIDGSQAYIARCLPVAKVVATVHDFIPLLQAKGRFSQPPSGRFAKWLILKSINELKKLDTVIADSQNTMDDFVRSAGGDIEKVQVIHPAIPICMIQYSVSNTGILRTDRRLSGPLYILHVGNNGFYKNRAGVLRVFARISDKHGIELKMAGPPPGPELTSMVRELNLTKHVHFVVNPDDDQIVELYLNAALLLFPSVYEGFGWPPLEAMTFGCPVVCSTGGSLPEVVGEAALKCNFDDYDQMARNCTSVLEDTDLANKLVQRGYDQAKKFCLERMGKELIDVYMKTVTKLKNDD